MKLNAALLASALGQSFNDHEEQIYQDGICTDVQIKAKVNQMWSNSGLPVDFTVTGFNDRIRAARLINDWSRLRLKLKYKNAVTGKYVDIKPPVNINSQWLQTVNKQGSGNNGNWRILFKDGQSRTLSDIATQTKQISFKQWINFETPINDDMKHHNFELEVANAQLCDGGYEKALVEDRKPAVPKGCVHMPDQDLANNYHKPTNGQKTSQVMIQSQQGQLGCSPYVLIGYDSPRTNLDVSNSHEITKATPLNFNLSPTSKKESSFWRLDFDIDRVKYRNNVNLQIDMSYFGSDEQAPVAYFLYNCDFGESCGEENNQQQQQQGQQQHGHQQQTHQQSQQAPQISTQTSQESDQQAQNSNQSGQNGNQGSQGGQNSNQGSQNGQNPQNGNQGSQNGQGGQGNQQGQGGQGNQQGQGDQGGQGGQGDQGGQGNQGGQGSQPGQPGQPGQPDQPGQPGQPGQPPQPGQPVQPGQPPQPGQPGQSGDNNQNSQDQNQQQNQGSQNQNQNQGQNQQQGQEQNQNQPPQVNNQQAQVSTQQSQNSNQQSQNSNQGGQNPQNGNQGTQGGQQGQGSQSGQGGQGNQGNQPGQPGQPPQSDKPVEWYHDELGAMLDDFITVFKAENENKDWSGVLAVSDLVGYGCVGGLDMNAKSLGKPADDLDRAIFAWRRCNRCAAKETNEKQCGYKINRNNQCSKINVHIFCSIRSLLIKIAFLFFYGKK